MPHAIPAVLSPPHASRRAALRRLLAASATVAATVAARPAGPTGPLHGAGCAPALCALEPATVEERRAIAVEAERLVARYDPDGNLAPVTGDAHLVEPEAGAGRVHIARGFDALNPARGIPAIVETARHEFAHLNGMGRRELWGIDDGARLAAACGPADEEPRPTPGRAPNA